MLGPHCLESYPLLLIACRRAGMQESLEAENVSSWKKRSAVALRVEAHAFLLKLFAMRFPSWVADGYDGFV